MKDRLIPEATTYRSRLSSKSCTLRALLRPGTSNDFATPIVYKVGDMRRSSNAITSGALPAPLTEYRGAMGRRRFGESAQCEEERNGSGKLEPGEKKKFQAGKVLAPLFIIGGTRSVGRRTTKSSLLLRSASGV